MRSSPRDRNGRAYAQLVALESAYKQLNADVGVFGIATLQASTKALEKHIVGRCDLPFHRATLTQLGAQRDALASRISEALFDLEFKHQAIAADLTQEWTNQANALMVHSLSEVRGDGLMLEFQVEQRVADLCRERVALVAQVRKLSLEAPYVASPG